MTDPVAALREGLRERYAFERELGRGGMATVWLARDLRHDRPVALKVLHPELAATLGPERFQREIRLAARLQHPHILTVHDSGDIPRAGSTPLLWFTMPFVEGESLRDRLRRERQLPVDDALRIAREAADALSYAHRHEVIHRDIKPENILLTAEGHSLVADFGIARALGGADPQLTETGLAIGTPAYMSPEQAVGDRGLDARTDVYSLGAVLYEMLAGEPPYTGATNQAILAKRFTEPAPSVQRVRPSVPESVDQAIRKALAPVAADRFSTVAQFAQALQVVSPAPTRDPSTVATPAPSSGPRPGRRAVPVAAVALVLGILIGLGVLFAWRRSSSAAPGGTGPKVLAVLPFENLGDSADAYFADGVADEVRTKLAQVAGLEVIARGSSVEYRGTTKRPAEIARDLGADYLLTGTVRWDKAPGAASRVRVTPELVDARPGEAARTRWSEQYDAALTNVFEVQAGIAGKVATALGVALADSVRDELASRPTGSLAAYDAFLQGEAASQSMVAQDAPTTRRAMAFYQQAVALDSVFVPAWARLSQAHAMLYAGGNPTAAIGQQALRAAERARRLAPKRPEGYVALCNYYRRVLLDHARALATCEAGLRLAPSNVDLLSAAGLAEQSLGRWEAALVRFQRAATLDPRSANATRRVGYTLMMLRRYADAETATDRAAGLAPTDVTIFHQKVMVSVARGDLDGARRTFRSAPTGIDSTELIAYFAVFEDLWWVLDEAQQRRLLTLPPSAFDDNRATWGLVRAQVYRHRGQPERARVYADSALPQSEKTVLEAPDQGQAHVLFGLTLAYAGRKAEAVREGERGVALQPMTQDAYLGPYIQQQLARIYLLVGEPEKALDQLEPLLRVPHTLSPGWLRIDPTWDALRRHPRFQKLVEQNSTSD
jgi:serine/threonine protein kinase/tetratricopeptide (TPR) repeat protein